MQQCHGMHSIGRLVTQQANGHSCSQISSAACNAVNVQPTQIPYLLDAATQMQANYRPEAQLWFEARYALTVWYCSRLTRTQPRITCTLASNSHKLSPVSPCLNSVARAVVTAKSAIQRLTEQGQNAKRLHLGPRDGFKVPSDQANSYTFPRLQHN